jgi:hypothetical protein
VDIESVDEVLSTTMPVRRRLDLSRPVEREVSELLGIPDTVTQVALLPVAYTIGTDFTPASRPPAETITSWNTWTNDR